jgi:hypothetical protein
MKAKDTWATWETELAIQRQQITEQAGCPMIRFAVDSSVHFLPYSRLLQAECQVREHHYRITAIWPGIIVTIEGDCLDKLAELLGEHRLHLVTLRSEVAEERQEDRPYQERISFVSAESATTCVNLREPTYNSVSTPSTDMME